jgi:hypothetical protein
MPESDKARSSVPVGRDCRVCGTDVSGWVALEGLEILRAAWGSPERVIGLNLTDSGRSLVHVYGFVGSPYMFLGHRRFRPDSVHMPESRRSARLAGAHPRELP